MNWIAENQNRAEIKTINKLIRAIVENTNYDNAIQVFTSSISVRTLLQAREKLYREGLN